MKKLLVLSDSHNNKAPLRRVIMQHAKEVDYIVHLGDHDLDMRDMPTADAEIILVKGNSDFGRETPLQALHMIEGYRFLCTHGHKERVKTSLLPLALLGQEQEADVVLFGHTHMPYNAYEGGMLLFNPGSIGALRQRQASYGMITVDKEEGIDATVFCI